MPAEIRESNATLQKTLSNPALQKLPDDAARGAGERQEPGRRSEAGQVDQQPRAEHHPARRILGTGETDLTTTIENLHQITDNLRDLTEETKRYPANVFFGAPPAQPERKP